MPDYGLTAGLAEALGVIPSNHQRDIAGAQSNFTINGVDVVATFWEFTRFLAERAAGVDLWDARKRQEKKLKRIQPLTAA